MAGICEKRVPVFFARLPSFQNFAFLRAVLAGNIGLERLPKNFRNDIVNTCNLSCRNGAYQGEGLHWQKPLPRVGAAFERLIILSQTIGLNIVRLFL